MKDCRSMLMLMMLVAVSAGLAAQQTPPRDSPAAALLAAPGRASISGRVMADDAPAQPMRRATVTAEDQSSGLIVQLAVTDDEGRFELSALPSGRYLVRAAKAAYLPAGFGSPKTTRAGDISRTTPIALADGQRVTDVNMRLVRGAVLTGVVRNSDGQPVRGVGLSVGIFGRTGMSERSLGYLPFNSQTDGAGRYRFFGLPPGDYVVMARYNYTDLATELTTAADLQRASVATPTGGSPTPTVATPAAASERRPTYGYTPFYYPGTPDQSRATLITLAAAEERSGVDLQIGLVQSSIIEGVAAGPDGRPAAGQQLRLIPAVVGLNIEIAGIAFTDPDGRFRFAGVPPGRYSIYLSGTTTPADRGFGLWSRTEVSVSEGRDVQTSVRLQSGVSLSGRVALESSAGAAPLDLSRVRLSIVPERAFGGAFSKSVTTRPDGQFTFTGVEPGRYRVLAQLTGTMAPGQTWGVTSALLNGTEALDEFADIQTDVADARVTVTDRVSEVTGVIRDGAGRAAVEHVVIVFPADRTRWTWGSRRIMQMRPSSDGKFRFSNLPAGDYLIGAATEVGQMQWYEPAFLEQLAGESVKLSLAQGEKKVQDLTSK